MTKKEKTNSGQETSGIGRISYPSVLETTYNELSEKNEYEVTILFDKEDGSIKTVEDAIANAMEIGGKEAADGKKNNPDFLWPIHDGDAKADSNPEMIGCFTVKFKSKEEYKPKVVSIQKDENNKFIPITDVSEVYGGCYGRVSFVAAYFKKGKTQGVGCYFNMLQKTRDGEAFGGASPEKAFDDIPVEDLDVRDDVDNF